MGRSLSQTVRSKSSQRQQQLQQKHSYQRIQDEPQSPSPDMLASPSPTGLVQALVVKRKLDDDDVHSQEACSSPPTATVATAKPPRPKRRATNAHIFRFLQTRNPTKLEENDLKRALEASLEECPDYWPAEDTASCSSSDQSNAPSASSGSSTGGGGASKAYKVPNATNTTTRKGRPRKLGSGSQSRRNSATLTMQQNHQYSSNICNCQKNNSSNNNNNINYSNGNPLSSNCPIAYTNHCPMSNVYNRYKPVTKKNIYSESDFFHDGIMEYIDYELQKKGIIE